jgi:FkbM family methyltransferase
MREFVIKRLRRASIIEPLWDEFERMLGARDAALIERDAALAARDAALIERDAALAARDAALIERDAALAARDAALIERDAALAARDAALVERESRVEQGIEAFCTAYEREPTPKEIGLLGSYLTAVPVSGRRETLRSIISFFDRQSYHTPVAIRFGQNDLHTVQLGGFKLVCDRLDRAVGRGIINEQHYEPHLTEFVQKNLKPGMTAVDIGANIGFFSMLFSSIVRSNGRVISFDPNTENCRLLLLSKEINGFDNIELYPIALSNMQGVVFFTPAIGSNGGLLPSTSETLMDPNCVVVPCDRLDNVVRGPVNFIKADIEGAEYLALSGG